MVVSSGYLANVSWVRTFVRKQDVVIYDERSHTSFLEGLRSTECRNTFSFSHNSMESLKAAYEKAASGANDVFIFTESLFSMDGDLPPLREISEFCRSTGAILVVDDAHGSGVLGESGRGACEHFDLNGEIDLLVGTLSKAFGCVGGFVCASYDIIRTLKAEAYPNIFTATLPPAIAAACVKSLHIVRDEPERVQRLAANSKMAREILGTRYQVLPGEGPIIPIVFPKEVNVQRIAFELLRRGVFVNCAAFPAVPINSPRLRITICSEHTEADILFLRNALDSVVEREARI
jgi:glycine C-acetyltransferase